MPQRRILILMGSPRKDGNTAVLARQLAGGAADAGAHVDTVHIHGREISPCTGCDQCHGPDASGCVIDDAMQEIYPEMAQADAVVFASPVYWFSVSAQLKAVIDRVYAIGGGGKKVLAGKSLGIVLVYADSDPFTSGAVNALRMFQDISAYLDTNIEGMVYGSAWEAGEVSKNGDLMHQAFELGRKLGSE